MDERLPPVASPEYSTSSAGEQYLPFEERITVSAQLLARLHYGMSNRPIDEAADRLLLRAGVVAVPSLLFSIVLVELLHAQLTRPLRRLGMASQQVRSGNYDIELAPGDDDEVGQLTEDFRHMVVEVKNPVSARTEAECELLALLAEAGIREEQLGEARREAKAASNAKSRFLAKTSHEIRAPLNGALGMLEPLRGDRLDERQQRYVKLTQESGRHLLEIVEDILDFSRIEAGRIRIEHSPFDARALFGDLVELLTPGAERKGLEIAIRFGTMPELLVGDAARCRQILENLIGNTVKFAHAWSIPAELSCRFDAILLDLQLPDIDGFEVARRLKAGWVSRGAVPVPIIALTANAFDSDRQRRWKEGMQGLVSKPCSQADLARALAIPVPHHATQARPAAPLGQRRSVMHSAIRE